MVMGPLVMITAAAVIVAADVSNGSSSSSSSSNGSSSSSSNCIVLKCKRTLHKQNVVNGVHVDRRSHCRSGMML